MKISTSDFEEAVAIGYNHGVNSSLAEQLIPSERKARIQDAVLEAYYRIIPTYHDCPEKPNPSAGTIVSRVLPKDFEKAQELLKCVIDNVKDSVMVEGNRQIPSRLVKEIIDYRNALEE